MDKWSFTMSHPQALLFLIPLFFLMWFSGFRRGRGDAVKTSGSCISGSPGSPGRYILMHKLSVLVFWLSLAAVAVSAAGPELTKQSLRYLSKGSEYFIVLDVSPSMAIKDSDSAGSPAGRIDAAKDIIKKIIAAGKNNYPGLILFGNDAVIAVPPTPDHGSFIKILDTAKPMQMGDGTSIGTAIALASNYLKDSGSEKKIIFLFSDGGHNTGEVPPLDAAEMADNLGISINCFALGKSGSNREIILEVEEGRHLAGYISSSFDPGLLYDISGITGGFCYEDTGLRSLHAGLNVLGSLESKERNAEKIYITRNLSLFFLIPGVLFLMLLMLAGSLAVRELVT